MKDDIKRYYWITFHYPGHFFGESHKLKCLKEPSIKHILKLKECKGAYAFSKSEQEVLIVKGIEYKREYNNAIRYFIDAELLDYNAVEKTVPDGRILLSNMKANNWLYVIKTNCGWYVPFEVNDVIIKSEEYK